MNFNPAAYRLSTATSLISLDNTVPYYTLMHLLPDQNSAQALKDTIRTAILRNRQEFIANPSVIPSLENHLKTALTERFGTDGTNAFFRWYKEDFVDDGNDFPHFCTWYMLLGLSGNNPERWTALELPTRLSEQARLVFCTTTNADDIKAINREQESRQLSAWDAHMYVIHGFNDDDDSLGMCPFMWIRETVDKYRFMNYLRWLKAQLSEAERQQFFAAGNTLRTRIETFSKSQPFSYPFADL